MNTALAAHEITDEHDRLLYFPVSFYISSWAYSFPLAALTIATAKMSNLLIRSHHGEKLQRN